MKPFVEELDPSDPAIVDEENERRHRALIGARKAITPIRDEVREEQRKAKRAYDIANPPHVQDAKAADAMMAQAASMRASGKFSEAMIAAVEHDAHVMRTRNLPRDPTLGPELVTRRKPFTRDMLEAEETGEKVEAVIVRGPVKPTFQQVREAQRAAQAEIAKRAEAPRVRVSELVDAYEEESVAELERRRMAR